MPTISITTTSSLGRSYLGDRANAIYPAFVDNMPYESWYTNWNGDYNVPPPTIATSRKDHFQLVATGASGYAWRVSDGSLPDGLELTPDGKIKGTATREGDYAFTVEVTVTGQAPVYKQLQLTAHPYRAKWHREARCGFWFTLGFTMYPQVEISLAGIAELETRFNEHFNAVDWVNQIKNLGFRYITVNAFTGDSLKTWPSTSIYEGKRNFKTATDYLRLIGEACHAVGLHLNVYVAADSFSTAFFQSIDPQKPYYSTAPGDFYDAAKLVGMRVQELPDGGKEQLNADPVFLYKWGQRNKALIRELSLMEHVDGYWFDTGATDPAISGAASDLAPWNNFWPLIRSNNPFQIVGINAGYDALGNLYQYPHIDFTVFEGRASTPGTLTFEARVPYSRPLNLTDGVPYAALKKMSIESANTFDIYWLRNRVDQVPGVHLKSFDSLTKSMQRNWDADVTYNLAVCVRADGSLIDPAYEGLMTQIGAFLNQNNNLSEAPRIALTGTQVKMSTARLATIYYTLDNSRPTINSSIYSQPIEMTQSAVVRAISLEKAKSPSVEERLTYKTQSVVDLPPLVTLLTSICGEIEHRQTDGPNYRGMVFVIGQAPLELYQVGRKYTPNLSNTNSMTLVIKQLGNTWTTLFDAFDRQVPIASDGYQYSNVAKTTLQAGMSYYIAIQENNTDNFVSNNFGNIPITNDLRITGPKVLSINGDTLPIPTDLAGQFINLRYKVLPTEKDLARGKPITFKRTVPPYEILLPNRDDLFAFNINDGDTNTYGQANAPEYDGAIEINLLTVQKIGKVVMRFFNNNFLSVSLGVGLLENEFNLIQIKTENFLDHIIFEFNPVDAQYVYLRTLLPNGAHQIGEGSTTSAVEIYR